MADGPTVFSLCVLRESGDGVKLGVLFRDWHQRQVSLSPTPRPERFHARAWLSMLPVVAAPNNRNNHDNTMSESRYFDPL